MLREVRNSNHHLLRIHRQHHDVLPPIGLACELLSFGQVSKTFQNLKHAKLRKRIAKDYQLPEPIYASFLHQASYWRNRCAHHYRLWQHDSRILWQLPHKQPTHILSSLDTQRDNKGNPTNRKLYNSLVMMGYLLGVIVGRASAHAWRQRLCTLLQQPPRPAGVPDYPSGLGFPSDWQQRPMWQHSL